MIGKVILLIFGLLVVGLALLFSTSNQTVPPLNPPSLTISQEFFWSSKPEGELIFVGDVMLSRAIGRLMEKKSDWSYPFRLSANWLADADLTIGNLEGPLSDKGHDQGGIYSFRADPRATQGLLAVGFDVLSLANNHMLDWGREALVDTTDRLTAARLMPVGAGRNYTEANTPYIAEVNGTKIAFLSYTNLMSQDAWATEDRPGLSTPTIKAVQEVIKNLRPQVNLIVLLWHWGDEYETAANPRERALARALIDAGADLIIGGHPHVAQEVEKYHNGYIAYSLGNFVFDQNFSEDTRRGLALRVVLKNGVIKRVVPLEVKFTSTFQPQIAVSSTPEVKVVE